MEQDASPTNDPVALESVMESVVRITLAGLGGSMFGLSRERKLDSMRVVTGPAATAAARRKRAAPLANLPLTWALSCMAFCAVIETSRRMEPTRRIMGAEKLDPIPSFGTTVVDCALGGAVGGLAASMGRNAHLQKQIPISMLRGSRRFFGVVPGIALGFVAGVFQASTDASITYLEEKQREQQR